MAKETKIWSKYQQDIFNEVANGTGNIIVSARAGSGKTSVICELSKHIKKTEKVLFVAFNKKIAVELDERINKSYFKVSTLHSYGFSLLKEHFRKNPPALDPLKTENIVKNILQSKNINVLDKKGLALVFNFTKAINLCKGCLVDIPSKIDILLDDFDIDTVSMDQNEFIKIICQTLRQCKEKVDCIDFSEMVWLPNILNIKPQKYSMVVIDELQDLNKAQVELALSACKKGGRIIGVGDPRQVLYVFTGSTLDNIEVITKRLNAKILPLPVSYRCAKNIIKKAQTIVPDINHAPLAKEGIVAEVGEDIFLDQVKPGDFILSRLNAPLIYHCLALIRRGCPANIAGRDVGNGLIFMIKRSETKNVNDFLSWLANWKKSEVERLEKKNRDPILIIDKYDCLVNLCDGAKSLDSVVDNIKEMFSDKEEKDIVVLATCHKSKGLERKRAWVLMNTFRKKDDEEQQNIKYVAYTRAQEELYLVI